MSDPAEDIAAALALFVNDPARGYTRTVVASVPEHPGTELKAEHSGIRVLFFAVGEIEEKESRSRVTLQPQVNMVVTANAEAAGERAVLAGVVREIRQSLRFASMAGWTWLRSETITKYDPEQMAKEQFLSAATISYLGIE